MKILYFSAMFEDDVIKKYFDKGKSPNFAANKYHRLLCEGIAAGGAVVNTYSILPISNYNSSKKIISWKKTKKGNLTKEYISFLNIPVIKHISILFKSFFKTLFIGKNGLVIYDPLIITPSFAVSVASKLSGGKAVAIVTDLPEHVNKKSDKLRVWINEKILFWADGYIFLTEQMNGVVNKNNKPFIVLEGHSDAKMSDYNHSQIDNNKRIVMYAGGLNKKYGIDNLVESFVSYSRPEEELHLYGNGNYVEEIKKTAKIHNNIKFFGSKANKEIVEAELAATLMVNPRSCEGEYTKYSFPSKTLEYMASGTPVLMAKLPGVPEDYYDFLYFFDDEQKNGLGKALRNVLDKSNEELLAFGDAAKKFALTEKNNLVQAKKIIDFINKEIL